MRPRWLLAAAFACILGFATAALASVPPTASRHCPPGSKLRHDKAWVCVKLAPVRTVTVTGPARTVSVPVVDIVTAPGTTTTLPGTTITEPGATVTTPPVTDTLPATTVTNVTTETQTITTPAITLPTATITQTVTDTVRDAPTPSLAWCGGHGGNWSDPSCDAPPNPLTVPSGGSVALDIASTGSLVAEPFPQGYLTYTVDGPTNAVWSEYDQAYGLNPDASQNCSHVENFSGQAEGACVFTFGHAGRYVVSVAFVDTDGNYGYPAPISATINVG